MLDTSGLTSGFRSLQGMLRENAEGFFRPVLESALDPAVDALFPVLSNALAVSRSSLLTNTMGILAASSNGLQAAMSNLNGAAGQANSVIGQVNQTLIDVTNTINLFLRVLAKDPEPGGSRHVVRAIIQKLVQDQGPDLGFLGDLADPVVNDLLKDLEPTLADIQKELDDLLKETMQLQAQLALVTGQFNDALVMAQNGGAALQDFLNQAGWGVSNLLALVVTPAGDFFSASPEAARHEIRERLLQAFLSSTLSSGYQATFRQFLFDDSYVLNQLMNTLFDEINRSIRNGLTDKLSRAGDGDFNPMKGLGLLQTSLFAAKIRGAPVFEGDSLRCIHLDANLKMHLPDEMNFNAFLDIKELNSQSVALSCIPAGAGAAEVTLGTHEVPLQWSGFSPSGGQPFTLSLDARWTLRGGAVLGVGGALGLKGGPSFKSCKLKEISAMLAIGQMENYFAAKAAATVTIPPVGPVFFQAGIFAGHACSLGPLKFVDEEADQVLGSPATFSGIYIQYGGGLSLTEALQQFIPVSFPLRDLFDVQAHITTALYYKDGRRFGAIGGRQKTSVDITLFALGGHADWAEFMALNSAGQLTVGGKAKVCGSAGPCPLCVKACKGVTITGVLNEGGVDYFLDY